MAPRAPVSPHPGHHHAPGSTPGQAAAEDAMVPAVMTGAQSIRDMRLARDGHRKPRRREAKNPLREGLRLERVPDPHTMVIFGATGDLSHRKVFPALAQLWRTNLLPPDWMLVAVGRRPYDDASFRAEIGRSLDRWSRVPLDEEQERQLDRKSVV